MSHCTRWQRAKGLALEVASFPLAVALWGALVVLMAAEWRRQNKREER